MLALEPGIRRSWRAITPLDRRASSLCPNSRSPVAPVAQAVVVWGSVWLAATMRPRMGCRAFISRVCARSRAERRSYSRCADRPGLPEEISGRSTGAASPADEAAAPGPGSAPWSRSGLASIPGPQASHRTNFVSPSHQPRVVGSRSVVHDAHTAGYRSRMRRGELMRLPSAAKPMT